MLTIHILKREREREIEREGEADEDLAGIQNIVL